MVSSYIVQVAGFGNNSTIALLETTIVEQSKEIELNIVPTVRSNTKSIHIWIYSLLSRVKRDYCHTPSDRNRMAHSPVCVGIVSCVDVVVFEGLDMFVGDDTSASDCDEGGENNSDFHFGIFVCTIGLLQQRRNTK